MGERAAGGVRHPLRPAPAEGIDPDLAARVLWFDALVQNVDRSWRNPNLLRWHGQPWLIDHGAALYYHHDGPPAAMAAGRVPDEWLTDEPGFADADAVRGAYADVLVTRAADPTGWLDAVEVARAGSH